MALEWRAVDVTVPIPATGEGGHPARASFVLVGVRQNSGNSYAYASPSPARQPERSRGEGRLVPKYATPAIVVGALTTFSPFEMFERHEAAVLHEARVRRDRSTTILSLLTVTIKQGPSALQRVRPAVATRLGVLDHVKALPRPGAPNLGPAAASRDRPYRPSPRRSRWVTTTSARRRPCRRAWRSSRRRAAPGGREGDVPAGRQVDPVDVAADVDGVGPVRNAVPRRCRPP